MSGATNKEKESTAERHGEENKNKSKERMGGDKKERRRKAGGEGEEGEAAKHMQPGWEQPGKQRNQSGSTGGRAAQEIVKRQRPRLREEGAAAAARTEKECMNRSQEEWRERTRKTRDGKGEEKGRQAHGTRTGTSGEAMRPDWNIRLTLCGRAIAAEEKKPSRRRTTRKNKAQNRFFRPQKPPKTFYAAVWRGRKI